MSIASKRLGDFPVLAFLDQPLGNWEKRIIFPNFQLSLNFSQPPMEKTLQKTNGKMSCVSFPGKKSFDKKGWSFHILALLLMTSEGAKEESVDSSLVCLIQIDMAIFSKKLKGFKSQKVSSAANRSALLNPSRLYPAACRLLPWFFFPLVINVANPTAVKAKALQGLLQLQFLRRFFLSMENDDQKVDGFVTRIPMFLVCSMLKHKIPREFSRLKPKDSFISTRLNLFQTPPTVFGIIAAPAQRSMTWVWNDLPSSQLHMMRVFL